MSNISLFIIQQSVLDGQNQVHFFPCWFPSYQNREERMFKIFIPTLMSTDKTTDKIVHFKNRCFSHFQGSHKKKLPKLRFQFVPIAKKKKKKIHDSTSVTLQKREKILRDLLHQKSNKY